MYLGSLCLSEINDQAKKGHSAFKRAKNGKIYFDVCIWLNSEPNKYGNDLSIQLSSSKEKRDQEGKIYLGNAKEYKTDSGFAVNPDSVDVPTDEDLPI